MKGPIQLLPAYQTYVWGGDRIAKLFHRSGLPKRVAESWEVSDREEGMSTIAATGQSLKALLAEMGEELVGKGRDCSQFPLLIKILDAKEHLSVQVHPDRPANHAEPKTEAWVALAPSSVLDGFLQIVSKEEVEQAIHHQTLPALLHKTDLAIGEADLIPGGVIHAILAGSLVLEVQQNSNTTYRLYDWGRVGVDGKPRELHLKEGLKALCYTCQKGGGQTRKLEEKEAQSTVHLLVNSPFFQIRSWEIQGEMSVRLSDDTFIALFIQKGEGEILCDGIAAPLTLGTSWIIPASAKQCTLFGHLTVIATSLPPKQGR